jgi:hypothetical protein
MGRMTALTFGSLSANQNEPATQNDAGRPLDSLRPVAYVVAIADNDGLRVDAVPSASNTKREGLPERKDALVSAWGRISVDTDPSMLRVNKSVCATQT